VITWLSKQQHIGDCHGCLSFHIDGQEFHVEGEGSRSTDEGNSFSTVFPLFVKSIVFKAILKNFKRVASFNVARHLVPPRKLGVGGAKLLILEI